MSYTPEQPELIRAHACAALAEIELLLYDAADSEALDEEARPEGGLEAIIQRGLDDGGPLPERLLLRRHPDLERLDLAILWVALSVFIDSDLRDAVARAQDNVLHNYVDPGLCLRLLRPDRVGRVEALARFDPEAPLFACGLLELRRRDLGPHDPLLQELVPAGHLRALFTGRRALSDEVARYGRREPTPDPGDVGAPPTALDDTLSPLLHGFFRAQDADATQAGCAAVLSGARGSGKAAAIRALAARHGRALLFLDGERLAHVPVSEARRCLATAAREAELYEELLVIESAEGLVGERDAAAPALTSTLRRSRALALLLTEDNPVTSTSLEGLILERVGFTARTEVETSVRLWREHLPEGVAATELRELATAVHLTRGQIRQASYLAQLLAPAGPETIDDKLLERAARAQITTRVGGLAEVSESSLSFSHLILDDDTQDQLEEVLAAIRNRQRVLREWGLASRIRRGLGISCLFDGEPGTGKTLSAEVIAAEAGLNLMRVNVAGIVDKYIGETEKNLTRIFDQVRPDTNLLLFDEADSLFSKRTEVSRSTDRYSNMEINVLLQLIERYEGVTVLTTNLKRSIDPAFERRITFKVNFPLPEEAQREQIWRHLLPEHVPTSEEIEYEYLATLELSGGEIKNAIVLAAYAAAKEKDYIGMRHLMSAARREAAATGRLLRDEYSSDFDDFTP